MVRSPIWSLQEHLRIYGINRSGSRSADKAERRDADGNALSKEEIERIIEQYVRKAAR